MKLQFRMAGAVALLLALGTAPAIGQKPVLEMLDHLEKGQWELRIRDDGGTERVCLRDGRELIQLRHQALPCQRHVVVDSATEVTVQYTCRGAGYGRTTVRRESGRLVQLDSQGIADGLPYAFAAEGRRVGDCSP